MHKPWAWRWQLPGWFSTLLSKDTLCQSHGACVWEVTRMLSLLGSAALVSRKLKDLDTHVTEELRKIWRPSHPSLFSVWLVTIALHFWTAAGLTLPGRLPDTCGLELAGSTSQRHRCKLMVVVRKVTTPESWPSRLHSSVSSTTRWQRSGTLTTADSRLWTPKRKRSDKGNMASKNSMGRKTSTSMVHCIPQARNAAGNKRQTPEEAGLHSLLEAELPSSPWRKEPWIHFHDVCLLLLLTLHHPTVITPHPWNTEQVRKKHFDRHVSPFTCNEIKTLPTNCAPCVLINPASAGFFGAFPLEHIITPLHLQRARVMVKP